MPLDAACGRKWLRVGQPALTACKRSAEGIVAPGETSREHHTEDSPRRRPERSLDRMVRVNGCGYQRACSYRHHAAVAEMSVTSGSFRPGRADVVYLSLL